jgi:hypothetical protein
MAMTIAESIAKAVDALPAEKQHEALAMIQRLSVEQPKRLISPEGLAGDQAFDISLEDFQALRREMWGTSTDQESTWHP